MLIISKLDMIVYRKVLYEGINLFFLVEFGFELYWFVLFKVYFFDICKVCVFLFFFLIGVVYWILICGFFFFYYGYCLLFIFFIFYF